MTNSAPPTNLDEGTQLLRTVFNALPNYVFVIDTDMQVYDYNVTAAQLLGLNPQMKLSHRTGDLMRCVNALTAPGGCGPSDACHQCQIRKAAATAMNTGNAIRQHIRLIREMPAGRSDFFARITVAPFAFRSERFLLLIIEDMADIVQLRELIPMCSVCKKLSDDTHSWEQLEAYFEERWGISFSHGLCPDCFEKEREKIENMQSGRK